jgi:hypothetical protein
MAGTKIVSAEVLVMELAGCAHDEELDLLIKPSGHGVQAYMPLREV